MNRDELISKIRNVLLDNMPTVDEDSGEPEYCEQELLSVVKPLLALFAQQRDEVLDELNNKLHDMIWTNSSRDKEHVFAIVAELKKGEVK